MDNRSLIDKLYKTSVLSRDEFTDLIDSYTKNDLEYARSLAVETAKNVYGTSIYLRGLIEFTNICRMDCIYCGLRRSNSCADRYRLDKSEILDCCREGYALGFRTFVLQGGEDPHYTDEIICDIVSAIKAEFPNCAVTLSIGERPKKSYQAFFDAGADRYLLRHESANSEHFSRLHPASQRLESRKECLYALKETGFQTGCGFMVGSPFQTAACLADDLLFIHDLKPHMVGIGPFIPHKDTPFHDKEAGRLDLTLFMLALVRIMEKNVLLPATTALGTINPLGREMGILSGANVVMPNLSPRAVREKYMLYNNKICTGDEAAECRQCLENRVKKIGYDIEISRGDFKEE